MAGTVRTVHARCRATPLVPMAYGTLWALVPLGLWCLVGVLVSMAYSTLWTRATSCFCTDPCTYSLQDLNRLTCFRKFWEPWNLAAPFSECL